MLATWHVVHSRRSAYETGTQVIYVKGPITPQPPVVSALPIGRPVQATGSRHTAFPPHTPRRAAELTKQRAEFGLVNAVTGEAVTKAAE